MPMKEPRQAFLEEFEDDDEEHVEAIEEIREEATEAVPEGGPKP